MKHRSRLLDLYANGPSRSPLPSNASNPAAELNPDLTIDLGGVAFCMPREGITPATSLLRE